jgi:hypothetical protein
VAFTNDAFISYSSEDRPWAQRVAQDLEAKGLNVFVDKPGLVAGAPWDEQLYAQLEDSQHLVVLWSGNAKDSDWVNNEFTTFRTLIRPPVRDGPPGPPRHIIPVYLEGEYAPFKKYEHIDFVREAGAYPAGPGAIDAGVWQDVMDKLEQSIRHAEATRPVPLLVITTTRANLSGVDPDKPYPPPPAKGESLNELIARLEIGSHAKLLDYYGDEPSDWRPFGKALSVKGILEQLKDAINQRLTKDGLQPFRWDYLDRAFWSNDLDQVAERLRRKTVVVVLDPLSLYDNYVAYAIRDFVLTPVRKNDEASLIVLPPFAMPSSASALRDSIQRLAKEVFDSYYNPPVDSARYARYVTSVGDEVDLKASVLAGIGPMLARQGGDDGGTYTRT